VKSKLIVVEHMEEYPTRWLIEEYSIAMNEAYKSGTLFLIAGVKDPSLASILARRKIPWTREHSWDLYDLPGTIVLDMWASRNLDPHEAESARIFVIGGIMGDYPPRGRGRLLSCHYDWSSIRKIGDKQMSIHTTVWALGQIMRGTPAGKLPLCDEQASFELDLGFSTVEITLPFAYPCDKNGRPNIPEKIRRILARGIIWDEEINLS